MTCRAPACQRPSIARDYCAKHYQRAKRNGTPSKQPQRVFTLSARFWKGVLLGDVIGDGCWEWQGIKYPTGYGQISLWLGDRQTTRRAHRVGYELLVGAIPDGLVLDHLCENRACVNPAHLEPVTQSVNVRRSLANGEAVSPNQEKVSSLA